jgi:hypothetical protein
MFDTIDKSVKAFIFRITGIKGLIQLSLLCSNIYKLLLTTDGFSQSSAIQKLHEKMKFVGSYILKEGTVSEIIVMR